MAKEPKEWITMNGNHIPIYEGQTKEQAVQEWLNKKEGNVSTTKSDYELARPNSTKLYEMMDNGLVDEADVDEMALKYNGYDEIISAMKTLDYDTSKYTDVDSIYDDGNLDDTDLRRIGDELLVEMSDDDVGDMMRLNGLDYEVEEPSEWENNEAPDEDREILDNLKQQRENTLNSEYIKNKEAERHPLLQEFGLKEKETPFREEAERLLNKKDAQEAFNNSKNRELEEENGANAKDLFTQYKETPGASDDWYIEEARKSGMTDEEIADKVYEKHDGPESNNTSDDNIKRLLAKKEKEKWQNLLTERQKEIDSGNLSKDMKQFYQSEMKNVEAKISEFEEYENKFADRINIEIDKQNYETKQQALEKARKNELDRKGLSSLEQEMGYDNLDDALKDQAFMKRYEGTISTMKQYMPNLTDAQIIAMIEKMLEENKK